MMVDETRFAPPQPQQASAPKAPEIKPDAKQAEKQHHDSVMIRQGMTVNEYVRDSVNMHYGKRHQGPVNGGLLQFCRKMGDMALAVIPKNRFWCAVGLTSGGYLGLKAGALLAGRNLNTQELIPASNYPKFLKPLHGKLHYDPHSSALPDRWKKVAALFTFTAVSFVGIMAGARFAYRNSRKRNEEPQSLEDYEARVGQHQGDKWRWLAASSGVFGSSAGTYLMPFVPGVNYGSSIAAYTVLNQDRKVMTPGLQGLSGTSTMSYLGLREGVDYICKYAVNNPSRDPAELEFLALTVMGPLADASHTKLTPQAIKTFVDKVHEVRDKYWVEGGIPRDQRKTAMKDMETHFKGKGLDKTLYECGIDTTRIDFTKINGLIGKVGNSLGATKKILADQEAYRTMAAKWRKEWMPDHPAPPGQPLDGNGIDIAQARPAQPQEDGSKSFAREDLKKPAANTQSRPATHREAVAASLDAGIPLGL